MKTNLEDVIGWENDRGNIICPKCFVKKFKGHYPPDWTPIVSEDKKEILYDCDEEDCEEDRFTN